ncbi:MULTISPECIES: SIMPL domain-containing protein [Niastella]|uniref:SIMPL domain-containing protein n=1 Tax=Niastella soli TaxID=2821487 RepID=A0ABS3YV69_9BACT|nr:SIMPL domain-containing protein [Niastella soli]MBO9201310.1 SIMPL domain-containing protein [Niastella soli]
MNRFIAIVFVCFLSTGLFAQAPNPFPKTINVTGSAELEIIPDEIYVVVTLKEYEKKGSGKMDLEKVKTDFLATCRNAGMPDSVISIASYEGTNPRNWWSKKSKDELYATIAYQLKFTNSKKIDELVRQLDDEATKNFDVVRVSHSKIQEYRKQLKIQAIKAAKAKAEYLTEAVGEQLGVAVTITENQNNTSVVPLFNANQLAKANIAGYNGDWVEGAGIDFKKIRLIMEMNVVFAIK